MTMMSFRVDEKEAVHAQQWADQLGVDKSQLLRDALHRHLSRLASEHDAATWSKDPLTDDELALTEIADWGVADDWSDWADATR